ncbi:ubiquinol oxidase subunit II [Polycladomyces subterraneus]|uniref:Quinol oxidase subunit 2 n=1 Tax=Polycladomyces subterraneus TaxID=1016997 RepID=A0ABT8IM17_9BACL|nr:ubiquinol oxidase subunit II [Polycladomyces subterraneus]MDN4593787.1 ubiquinol oxidase subunit II [Polycladomyces subterraneus]
MKKTGISSRLKQVLFSSVLLFLLPGCSDRFALLDPAGPVAHTEYRFIVLSAILVSLVVIPVLGLLIYIVIRYRDRPGNQAPYRPNWTESKILEAIWWGIPILIVAILGVFTVRDTYALTRPPTNHKPITIQVVSLDWKWMFLYPDSKIATVNYCEIPTGVPVQFVLTADAPMNSFWVPRLGGQVYTMPGMEMQLWLQADRSGVFEGRGANFTGKGFAHMNFQVVAKPQSEFESWVKSVKASAPALTNEKYNQLVKPSVVKQQSYSSYPTSLYKNIVNKNGGMYWHGKHEQHPMPMDGQHQMPMGN